MLQKLREKTSGWIAAAILVLLIIPFAFFGIENYFQQQVETYVAKVNDAEIDPGEFRQRFDEFRNQMRQMMGEQFDAQQFETAESKRQVLDRLIDEELLRQAGERMGVVVPQAQLQKEISDFQAFQTDGKFDKNKYVALLQSQGMTPRSFQERMQRDLELRVLPSQLLASGFVPDEYVTRYLALRDQTRSFDYVIVPLPAADTAGEVSDDEIKTYYDQHADRYMTEERVTLEYLELDASKLEVPVSADEDTLRARYEEQKSRYVQGEQRLASHILIKVAENADADAQKTAQNRAQELATKARGGADFAALAKEASDDLGSKNTGGDLGWVEKGIFDPAFEAALFALQQDGVSDPVKGADGWHVIQLRDIKAETGKPFEEVRAELEREYFEGERERMFSDLGGRLVDVIYRDPTTLTTASQELGLPIQKTESFTRSGAPGLAGEPDVLKAAFSAEVLVQSQVSEPITLPDGRMVVIRTIDHVASAPQKLEEVRDGVRAAIVSERLAKQATEETDKVLVELRGGKALAAIAGERKLELKTADKVGRIGATVDPTISEFAFGLPHPGATPSVDKVELPGRGYALVSLTAVADGDPAKTEAEQKTALTDQLSQAIGGAEAQAYVQALRKAATIEVFEDRM